MRRVRHPAPGWRRRERRRSAYARAAGFRFALALVLAPLTFEYASAWESGETTSGERGAMTNWASDGSTGAVSARGQDAVEASRVTLAVTGGPVIVQWSLSYQAHVNATSQGPARGSPVYVHAVAALERDGVEIARSTLGEDEAQVFQNMMAQARIAGTASGLFVDRTPGSGRKTYVLKVRNDRPSRYGVVTVSTRTMICEER